MTATDLPTSTFNMPPKADDLAKDALVYKDELLSRLRLAFGDPDYITSSSCGIVTDSDPTTVTTSSTKPLVVTVSDLTINVLPGIAVTKSGHRIKLSASVTGITLSSYEEDAVNVVALQYTTTVSDTADINLYHVDGYRRRLPAGDSDYVVVYTLAEWTALTYSDDHVPLAVVTVQMSGDTKTLTVTHSNSSYTFLRPWFSPVDVKHRSYVGSGTTSTTNPHGTTWNELTVGDFTLPQIVRKSGVVIAKEASIPGNPGTICTATIQPSQILTDDTSGTVTGTPSANYVKLPYYPVALGTVVDTLWGGLGEFPFAIVPGTQIIYQPANSYTVAATAVLSVPFTRVTALEPPSMSNVQTSFTAGSLASTEAVLTNGEIKVSTSSLTLTDSMGDASYIPIKYLFYLSGDKIVKNPQVIVCRTKISDIDDAIVPSITPLGTGVALVALVDAIQGVTLDVEVRITGTLTSGISDYEVLTFGSGWSQPTVPYGYTHSGQFMRGTKVWSSITQISIDKNLNSGDEAAIQVYMVNDPTTSPNLAYACLIADTQWDGTKFAWIKDKRAIYSDLAYSTDKNPGLYALAVANAVSDTLGNRNSVFMEDFRRCSHQSLILPTLDGASQGIERPWVRERGVDTLLGYYESRAIPILTTTTQATVFMWPPLPEDRNFLGGALAAAAAEWPLVWWCSQDGSTGDWGNWVQATNVGALNMFAITGLSDQCAIKFAIEGVGRGQDGFVFIAYAPP